MFHVQRCSARRKSAQYVAFVVEIGLMLCCVSLVEMVIVHDVIDLLFCVAQMLHDTRDNSFAEHRLSGYTHNVRSTSGVLHTCCNNL